MNEKCFTYSYVSCTENAVDEKKEQSCKNRFQEYEWNRNECVLQYKTEKAKVKYAAYYVSGQRLNSADGIMGIKNDQLRGNKRW